MSSKNHAKHNFKNKWTLKLLKTIFIYVVFGKKIHISCFGLLYNKSLDIITHSKCMHNKLSPTSDHCHSRAKKGVRAQLDRVRNSEVHTYTKIEVHSCIARFLFLYDFLSK